MPAQKRPHLAGRTAPFQAAGTWRTALELAKPIRAGFSLALLPTLGEAGSYLYLAEEGPEIPRGAPWPRSSSEFVAPLLDCLAGLGTRWAPPSMSSIHLAGQMVPCSWILRLRELISLLLALSVFCWGAAHPLASAALGTYAGMKPIC